MALVGLTNVNHYFGERCIFANVSFAIEKEQRIGLIGVNGTGKTTLLDILSGRLTPTSGQVHKQKKLHISYLSQSFKIDDRCSLLSYVLQSHKRVINLAVLIKKQEQKLQHEPTPQNMRLLDDYQAEFLALEGYALEHRAKTILQRLSFTEQDWERDVMSFSGGEQTRIQLAASLIAPGDLILLDEPTNHLDIMMRDWLEQFLSAISKPYIIVSHDRDFLEKTVNTILSIENGTTASYKGNYSQYEAEFRLRQKQQLKTYEAQQDYIDKTKAFIRKNIAGQKTKQAKSRLKVLNKMEIIDKPKNESAKRIQIQASQRSGEIVFAMENVAVRIGDNDLLNDLSATVVYQDRIAVLGPNGCGKTTFLQTITGERKPRKGFVRKGAGVNIGYYDQLHIFLNPESSIGETLKSEHPDWNIFQLLSYLARFSFYEQDIEKKTKLLSGGEKARLYLALLISRKPNVLIMDEPTNHLDIFMIKSLEDALKEYDGTIIFVSHDRRFINNIANRFWLFNDKVIKETTNWEILLKSNQIESSHSGTPTAEKADKPQKTSKNKKVNPIVLEKKLTYIEQLESRIDNLEQEVLQLQNEFLKKEILRDGDKIKQIKTDLSAHKDELSALRNELLEKEEDYLLDLESGS